MRAIVLEGQGRISVRNVPAPEPGPGEALIDIRYAGICGTDLQLARGYMEFTGIPGHEFVGTVSRVQCRADRLLLGSRVAGEINIGCEDCPLCLSGLSRHCSRRKVLGILDKDGAFAEQVTLPVRNLHAVPDAISDAQAVFIEPVAAALEILEQVDVTRSTSALVLGDGRLGLLASQALRMGGSHVTVEGHHERKLALARELGFDAVLAPGGCDGNAYDLVVEATGSPVGLEHALGHVRPRGTVVVKTTTTGSLRLQMTRIVVDEMTLVGSRCGRFEPAIQALESGAVKVDDLISSELLLDQGVEAFRMASAPENLKVLLRVAR